MENLREEMVETTVDVAEEVVEKVVVSNSKTGKVALIVTGVALVGLGVYKLRKFIKNKRADKHTDATVATDAVTPESESNGNEDSEK